MRGYFFFIFSALSAFSTYSQNSSHKCVNKKIMQKKENKVKSVYQKKEIFFNKDCEKTYSCDLNSFSIYVEEYTVDLNKKNEKSGSHTIHHGTTMFAAYKTKSISSLEDFAIVNFIQGCHFMSRFINGKVFKELSVSRPFFDDLMRFHHPLMVIDSVDKDPMYASHPEYPFRHYGYKWNRSENSYSKSTQEYFGIKKPERPELYISDRPGTAFLSQRGQVAKNISLKFITCIYKTNDIPFELDYYHTDFAMPIYCFNWNSSYVYNHYLEVFETKKGLDPICLEEFN